MRILIREIRRAGNQALEHSDSVHDGDVATIGRATDQVIQLADRQLPLAHSELRDSGRALQIKSVGDEHFFVNGSRTTAARLSVDDLVEIGDYVLVVRDAPEGCDYAIDFERVRDSGSQVEFGAEFVQSLDGTRLSRRMWSWTLLIGVLLLTLITPAVGLFDRDLGIALRALPVPDDGLWNPGPLHESHSFIGNDCGACHVSAFSSVRDDECVACHTSVTHHVDNFRWQIEELENEPCAGCHKEHNEPSVLARRDQGLCADCHADLGAITDGGTELDDAADFGEAHPEFRLSMLRPTGSGLDTEWRVERVALDDPSLEETSNLVFPHAVHMDAEGITGPTGQVQLVCGDCHEPESGGAYMAPITMEQHCADCHRLTFDDDAPDRELPHGEPDLIVRLLEEYYAREALFGEKTPAGRPLRAARRPGQVTPMTVRQRTQGMEETTRKALLTAETIFERSTCKICHVVTRTEAQDRDSPWQVEPVRIAPVWMPKGWFSHEAHVEEDCARCHASEVSTSAADVSMPSIESCRDCHGGDHAQNRLASGCSDCHVFHLPGRDLMRPDVPGSRLRATESDLDRMRETWRETLTPVRAGQ